MALPLLIKVSQPILNFTDTIKISPVLIIDFTYYSLTHLCEID